MNKLKGQQIVDFLNNIVYEDKQVQDYGVHLTVGEIHKFRTRGEIDFGGGEYKKSKSEKLPPQKRTLEDKYGWWELEEGIYLLKYNEEIKNSPSQEKIFILQPANWTLRNGASHPTITIDEKGPIKIIIRVEKPGLNIKENARISKLTVLT